MVAITKLSGELNTAYLRLYAKRKLLTAQRVPIAMLKEQMDRFAKERDHIQERLR